MITGFNLTYNVSMWSKVVIAKPRRIGIRCSITLTEVMEGSWDLVFLVVPGSRPPVSAHRWRRDAPAMVGFVKKTKPNNESNQVPSLNFPSLRARP